MKHRPWFAGTAFLLVAGVFWGGAAQAVTAGYLSPVDVVADAQGTTLYIAQTTAKQIAVFDIASEKVTKTISLPAEIGSLVLSRDGSLVYADAATQDGRVFAVSPSKGAIVKAIPVGHTPGDLIMSPDGGTLYVCNRFDNDISVVDLREGKETARIKVSREPAAALVAADGKTLFVANHLPAGAADGAYAAAEISVVDTASNRVVGAIQLPNGSMALRDIAMSPDGKYAYVTHILARYQLPTTQLERGWMNTNALTIVDVANRKRVNTVLLDDVDLGAANPWAVVCTDDGKYICITTAGTHELSVIDRTKLHDKLTRAAAGENVSDASSSAEDVPNDLSFLVDLKRRLRLAGNGPRGLTVIGGKAYAAEYFTDSLAVVDIDRSVQRAARSIPLGPQATMTEVRRGEMFFHDATLCFQQWQSCSSCHPGDARVDALNWDLLNDGLGNPKNTKSLLLAHQTPPAMAMGVRATAEIAVRAGIRHIQFADRPEEDALAIDRYLESLRPVASPYLAGGTLSSKAKRGQKLFQSAGCAACHAGRLYTDGKAYNLGMGILQDEDKPFDTPSLIEVWRTAPYLHDGRAATILDVLKTYNRSDRHGVTSTLTDGQMGDLAEFVLSL